jgi:hypothetical protein
VPKQTTNALIFGDEFDADMRFRVGGAASENR